MYSPAYVLAIATGLTSRLAFAQDCSSTISATAYPAPSLANGWSAHIVANELSAPRSLKLDNNGHLLVLDQAEGVVRLTLDGEAPCTTISDRQQIISNSSLNHGLELSPDNTILYASSQEAVYAWAYDSETGDVSGDARRVITLGGEGGHSSRTIFLPPRDPDMMVVSWGSMGNIDPQAREPTSGYSKVKAFNISDQSVVWDFASEGIMVGWGLRNSVGLGQHPTDGGIWSNENNVDNLSRNEVSIVEDNPAEELNFHGYLNGTQHPNFGAYYGYPDCFPVWDLEDVPNNNVLQVGSQFAATSNDTIDDAWCAENTVNPTLSFTAHMAPMDLEFNTAGTAAYITFRGSWNREEPAGYKLSMIPFDNSTGRPVAASNQQDNYVDVMTNEDTDRCPDECFRPVGLEWSADGAQLFMASDATGEIYIVYRADGSSTNDFSITNVQDDDNDNDNDDDNDDDSDDGGSAATRFSATTSWALGLIALVIAWLF